MHWVVIVFTCEDVAERTESTWLKISDGMILVGVGPYLDPHSLDLRYVQNICIIQ